MTNGNKIEIIKKGKFFRTLDIVLIALFVVFAIFFFAILPNFISKGEYAEIMSDGKIIAKLPLDKDSAITVNYGEHYNVVEVKDGYVYVSSADCHDKTCLSFGKKNGDSEQIICLPHKLVITIRKGGSVDVVS